MNRNEEERYSVCIVVNETNAGNQKQYIKYYRVADFAPEDDDSKLAPALIQEDVTSLEESVANPDTLYNPSAASNYESRDSDFYLFRWRLNAEDMGKQFTKSFHDDVSLLAFNETREVIVPEGVSSSELLRTALDEGIPFEGKTTKVFYLAYAADGRDVLAVRCDRSDFDFVGGRIRLGSSMVDVRGTVLSAPRVRLDGAEIIESRHASTGPRKVYAQLGEIEQDGSILLRSLSYFAADYVKWFVGEESIGVSRTDRRNLTRIIDAALCRPEALEEYLGAGASEAEVERMRHAIAHDVVDQPDSARELIRDALLEDGEFLEYCIGKVRESDDERIAKGRAELDGLLSDVAAAKDDLGQAAKDAKGAKADLEALKEKLDAEREELAKIRADREEALDRLEKDAALRLGLRLVSQPPSKATKGLVAEGGEPLQDLNEAQSLSLAIQGNLRRMRIISILGDSDKERRRAARGIRGALSATRVLAMPSPVASHMADAVSISLFGRTASRLYIPSEFKDAQEVIGCVSSESGVVVVDNVLDAVNESVLFPLVDAVLGDAVVVLPFTSYANLALLSKEVWGRMFYPCVETLVHYPRENTDAPFWSLGEVPRTPRVSIEDALSVARDLAEDLSGLELPADALLLPAMVLRRMDDIVDDEDEPLERFVTQHLAVACGMGPEEYDVLSGWSYGDAGLVEIARKLGRNGR